MFLKIPTFPHSSVYLSVLAFKLRENIDINKTKHLRFHLSYQVRAKPKSVTFVRKYKLELNQEREKESSRETTRGRQQIGGVMPCPVFKI